MIRKSNLVPSTPKHKQLILWNLFQQIYCMFWYFLWWFALPIAQFFILVHFLCLDFIFRHGDENVSFVRKSLKMICIRTNKPQPRTMEQNIVSRFNDCASVSIPRTSYYNIRSHQPLNGFEIKSFFITFAFTNETQDTRNNCLHRLWHNLFI